MPFAEPVPLYVHPTNPVWSDCDDRVGILEFEAAPGLPALELHILRAGGESAAFWMTAQGEMLGLALVGEA